MSFIKRNAKSVALGLVVAQMLVACKKDEEDDEDKLTFQPQLMRLPVSASTSLTRSKAFLVDPADDTSLMRSFTPTSIRLSITDISISSGDINDWNTPTSSIYRCSGSTNAECMIEVSNLQAFEDALNAEPAEVEPGTYTKVRVGMCATPDSKQTIEITGSTSLNGVSYITDTDNGIIAGEVANAKPVTFEFSGCAVQVPLAQEITAELNAEQKVEAESCVDCAPTVEADVGLRLLFDSFNFAAMGNMGNKATKQLVANSADNLPSITFNESDSSCRGDKAGLFICTQRTALYATDDQAPKIKRFSIALTDSGSFDSRTAVATPDPTAYTAFMLRSDDVPLAIYTRRSVDEGAKFNMSVKGDENYFSITKNADGSYGLGEGGPNGGTKLHYDAFKLEDHDGNRLTVNGQDTVPYHAALLP